MGQTRPVLWQCEGLGRHTCSSVIGARCLAVNSSTNRAYERTRGRCSFSKVSEDAASLNIAEEGAFEWTVVTTFARAVFSSGQPPEVCHSALHPAHSVDEADHSHISSSTGRDNPDIWSLEPAFKVLVSVNCGHDGRFGGQQKPVPSAMPPIVKEGGCNLVSCTRSECHFCWVCPAMAL